MTKYLARFEGSNGIQEFSFEAIGRTSAERMAESWIDYNFFKNREVTIRYFYTLLDLDKDVSRKITCCNQMSYPRHGEENKHGIKM